MQLSAQDLENKLMAITQHFLNESGYENRKIQLDTSLQNHLGLGSFARIELFHRIEKQFDFQLDDKAAAEIDTLRELIEIILKSSLGQKVILPSTYKFKNEKFHIDPSQANTLIDVLLLFAKKDSNREHVFFQDKNGKEIIISYGTLLENALKIAQSLLDFGVLAGDKIAMMLPNHPEFLYTFFGILFANCIPIPMDPSFQQHFQGLYANQLKILKNANVRLLVTESITPKLNHAVVTVTELLKNNQTSTRIVSKAEDIALIQYIAGNSNMPKGVLLTHQNLLANIRAFGKAIEFNKQDRTVIWLPLYRVMGLIGMWLGSLYHGIPVILISPNTFLNRPEQWLWTIHYHNATISGGPNFAYELCVRKIVPAQIEGLNLSSWRLAINGAETIRTDTITRFYKKFSPYGFKLESVLPVYGLAESSACIAVSSPQQKPRIDKIERDSFEREGHAIQIDDHSKKPNLAFVSSGKTIPGHLVRVVDEVDNELPDRTVGHLQFKGPSSMQGYDGDLESTEAIFHNGWWETGDLAYLDKNEIFITGRAKDTIIKAGDNLSPLEIEEVVNEVAGIRKDCVVAFGVEDSISGTEKIVLIAETNQKSPIKQKQIVQEITEIMGKSLNITLDKVVLVPPNAIYMTSGSNDEINRTVCKSEYLQGKFSKTPFIIQSIMPSVGFVFKKITYYLCKLFKLFYSIYAIFVMTFTFLPFYLTLWILSTKNSAKICHYSAKIFFILAFCPIKIVNKNNLYKYKRILFLANHSSYIDVLVLFATLPPDAKIVGKQELVKAPIIGTVIQKLKHIMFDRENFPEGISKAIKEIKEDLNAQNPVLIFPEGTFTYAEGLRPFKFGAFKIAAETDTPLLPITIQGTRKIFRDGDYLAKPYPIKITVGEPIFPDGTDWKELIRLRKDAREQIAKYCGEPSLNYISVGKPYSDLVQPHEKDFF